MFGESIAGKMKEGAEHAIEGSGRLLVVGTSLATYSAWRLARKAQERGMPIGILNLGGVRGEDAFFQELPVAQRGEAGVRIVRIRGALFFLFGNVSRGTPLSSS
jgi:NAD-dependent SIR2 family protein deacetylase